jgi:hypothetical protein
MNPEWILVTDEMPPLDPVTHSTGRIVWMQLDKNNRVITVGHYWKRPSYQTDSATHIWYLDRPINPTHWLRGLVLLRNER